MEEKKNFYALHAVIFKKKNGWTLDKAEEEVNNFIKSNKKHFYRETKSSFRFRNIPKQKFISKTFRTKNLKNGISLIMGELKPDARHLEGAGIFDLFKKPVKAVKEFFSPRKGYNNTTTKNLNAFGNIEVKSLTIVRTPIMGILDKALNLVSFGKWAQLKKEYGHDKLFHLALIANLGNKNLVIEKNEVINVNTSYKMGKESETMNVDLKGKKFTINQMLDATKSLMGEKNFYSYDGLNNNCQTFIKSCLMSMGLYDAEENDFVFQDLSELAKKFPSISKKIMNATTNLGAVVNKLTGQGEMKGRGGEKREDETEKEYRRRLFDEIAEEMKKSFPEKKKKEKEMKSATSMYYRGETDKTPIYSAKGGINELRKYVRENALPHKENIPVEIVFKSMGKREKRKYDNLAELWYVTPENELKIDEGINTEGEEGKLTRELRAILADPRTSEKDKKYYKKLMEVKTIKFGNEKLKFEEDVPKEERAKENSKIQLMKKSTKKLIYEAKNKKDLLNFIKENVKPPAKNIAVLLKQGGKMFTGGITPDLELVLLGEYKPKAEPKVEPKVVIDEPKRIEIKEIKQLTLKQLKKVAEAFNKHMNIVIGSKTKKELVEELEKHLEVVNGELALRPHVFEIMKKGKKNIEVEVEINKIQDDLNNLVGSGKKSLEDEFKMDEKDHEKKLSSFEKSNPSNEDIKETLAGLKSITESGLTHIKKLEEMLELEGGSAKSAGFIRAIMARKKAEEEGKETTRDDAFKNYKKNGFKEQKLNKSSKDLVDNVFEDGIYKKLVLNFAILGANYLYNTKGIRDLYNKEPEKAKKAVETIEETLGDEKKVLDALKKQVPNYNELTETEKIVYMMNYKQAVRASIMSKYFEGMKPIEVEITEELKERMKQNYIRWYNKNKKSKKPPKTEEYNELLEKIENLKEGDELELPVPTKGKKETIKKLKDEVKEVKRKRTNENEPSKERKAVDDALLEFMKRQKVSEKKKPSDDDFEDLLAENGLTMEDLENI